MFQAEYDLHAAKKMMEAGVYPYAVFMCHLAVEKALKSLYVLRMKSEPPKIHDLKALAKSMSLDVPEKMEPFIGKLSAISIPARYPEDLKHTLRSYDRRKTKSILSDSEKVLKWLKKESTQK